MAEARIFADLKADHDRQRSMLKLVAEMEGNDQERQDLYEELRLDISAHAAAEEESLYATMLANPDLRDEARHSVSEHKEVDDFFADLAEQEFGSAAWEQMFQEMRHRYEHHIDEEEEEMFPAASRELSSDEEERLGKVFEQRKPKELERAEASSPGDDRE